MVRNKTLFRFFVVIAIVFLLTGVALNNYDIKGIDNNRVYATGNNETKINDLHEKNNIGDDFPQKFLETQKKVDMLDIFVIGLGGGMFIIFVFLFSILYINVCKNRKILSLKREIGEMKLEFEKLKKVCEHYENSIKFLHNEMENIKKNREEKPLLQNTQSNVEKESLKKGKFSEKSAYDEIAVFMRDYQHLLSGSSGYDLRQRKQKFIENYKLRQFSCRNTDERMKDPQAKAIFVEKSSGDFWAFQGKAGNYLVVPRAGIQYDWTQHGPGAMNEVFVSDFANNGSYSNVKVEKPALFSCIQENWIVEIKGKLQLS